MVEGPRPEGESELAGVRLLVVEDDTLILMDLEAVFLEAGAEIVALCRSVSQALPFVDGGAPAQLDAAVLDFGLNGETVAPIARCLIASGTPFLFYTGQVETDPRLAEWLDCKIVAKPARPAAIIHAVASLLPERRVEARASRDEEH